MHPQTAERFTSVMPVLFTLNKQTKFEVSSFIRSKDMAWAKNVEMGQVTLATPTWGQSVITRLILHMPTRVQNLKSLAVAVAEIFQGV